MSNDYASENGGTPPADRFAGCLLGQMVGDALGLPREGLSAQRAVKLFGTDPHHALLPGRGMISDDSEHACLTAQALCDLQALNTDEFARRLAWKLRGWLAALPAGVGLATLRAIGKLWLGWPLKKSGVASAGNGPAMRAPIIGVFFANHPGHVRAFTKTSTRLTHTDQRAEIGAHIVAICAAYAAQHDPTTFKHHELMKQIREAVPYDDAEAARWLATIDKSFNDEWDAGRLLSQLGCSEGLSGYMYHTVPGVLAAWLRDPFDFAGGMRRVFSLGGDADTAAAIFGALAGAAGGTAAIPAEWLAGVSEWPRSVAWQRELAASAAERAARKSACHVGLGWRAMLLPARNLFFLMIVLGHGFRRILPPY